MVPSCVLVVAVVAVELAKRMMVILMQRLVEVVDLDLKGTLLEELAELRTTTIMVVTEAQVETEQLVQLVLLTMLP